MYYIMFFLYACPAGQVGNVITNRNASRLEFERLLVRTNLHACIKYISMTLLFIFVISHQIV